MANGLLHAASSPFARRRGRLRLHRAIRFGRGTAGSARPPVIDMHVHSTNVKPAQELERTKARRYSFHVSCQPCDGLGDWADALDRRTTCRR